MNDEDFQCWLAHMDEALNWFRSEIALEVALDLDLSPESLNVLEKWTLSKYDSTDAMLESNQSRIVDALGRYIGETFRKTLGGHWRIRFDDPDYVFYGIPEVTGFCKTGSSVCPVTLATASADRRSGEYIFTVFSNYRRRKMVESG
jgi:hypothetical protein